MSYNVSENGNGMVMPVAPMGGSTTFVERTR